MIFFRAQGTLLLFNVVLVSSTTALAGTIERGARFGASLSHPDIVSHEKSGTAYLNEDEGLDINSNTRAVTINEKGHRQKKRSGDVDESFNEFSDPFEDRRGIGKFDDKVEDTGFREQSSSTEDSIRQDTHSHNRASDDMLEDLNGETSSRIPFASDKKAGNSSVHVSKAIVQITVIYESYCPYSRRFMYSQLWPVYHQLKEYLNVTLYPFGKAQISNDTDDDGHTATNVYCPHGVKECQGNTIETCVIKVVRETLKVIKIIACMSEDSAPDTAGERCVTATGVEWSLIQSCVAKHGQEYLLEMGENTWKIEPDVMRVPLVVVDGETSNAVEVTAQKDLFALVCHRINVDNLREPEACTARRRRR
uniref:Putative gamma-interferon inducible lysosomal thiol reductase n=1 Tax=Ixodes ricinus TaxID=34613 RepID=A0A6B0VAG8_IXORI